MTRDEPGKYSVVSGIVIFIILILIAAVVVTAAHPQIIHRGAFQSEEAFK